MPGIGIRLWHPFYRSGPGEISATVVNTVVADPIGLNGTTIPYKSLTGSIVVRMVGRANTATRPLAITVKWGALAMKQETLFAESGAGGAFVGIWSLFGQTPATKDIVITCGAQDAGCCAVRCGELQATIGYVKAGSNAGYGYTASIAVGGGMLIVGGSAESDTYPFTSDDAERQWQPFIPPKTDLPNRTHGLAGYFGMSYASPADGRYDIVPAKTGFTGVIAGLEITLAQAFAAEEFSDDQVQANWLNNG